MQTARRGGGAEGGRVAGDRRFFPEEVIHHLVETEAKSPGGPQLIKPETGEDCVSTRDILAGLSFWFLVRAFRSRDRRA